MNRRSSDGQDSDSSASRSTSRGSTTPRPPTNPPPPRPPLPSGYPLHTPQWSYVGESNTHLPLSRGRRWRRNTIKDEETRFPPEGTTPPSDADPPPVHTFRVTDIPSFNPSMPPPGRRDCVSGQTVAQCRTPAKRESSRPQLRPPETFPRSLRQVGEDRRRATKRAKDEQTWTTTVYGLEEDEPTQTPNRGYAESAPSSVESAPPIGSLPYTSATGVSPRS